MAKKRRNLIFFSWALLFTYFLCDDALQIHERFGIYLANHYDLQPAFLLRAQDFGEIIISSFFGFLLFTFISFGYFYSDSDAKKISKNLVLLVIFIAFFGVFVDMLRIAFPWGKTAMGLVEDGGEMVIMSLILWYVFGLKSTTGALDPIHEPVARD